MTDATELDEEAMRARAEDHAYLVAADSRKSLPTKGAMQESLMRSRRDVLAALNEITRLRAALDEARAERESASVQPEGTEHVEWGVRDEHDTYGGGSWTEEAARYNASTIPGAVLVRRTVTTYAPVVGPWETVEDRS